MGISEPGTFPVIVIMEDMEKVKLSSLVTSPVRALTDCFGTCVRQDKERGCHDSTHRLLHYLQPQGTKNGVGDWDHFDVKSS